MPHEDDINFAYSTGQKVRGRDLSVVITARGWAEYHAPQMPAVAEQLLEVTDGQEWADDDDEPRFAHISEIAHYPDASSFYRPPQAKRNLPSVQVKVEMRLGALMKVCLLTTLALVAGSFVGFVYALWRG